MQATSSASPSTPAQRAAAEKLIAYPTAHPLVWQCSKYTVRITGPEPADVHCSCPDSTLRNRSCKHAETVAFFRREGVRPIRPADVPEAPAHAVSDVLDPLHSFCRGCGAESFTGVTLCILCTAARQEQFGIQEAPSIRSPWMCSAEAFPIPDSFTGF